MDAGWRGNTAEDARWMVSDLSTASVKAPLSRRIPTWRQLASSSSWRVICLLVLSILLPYANAAFINFDNCLPPGVTNEKRLIQFTPLHVWAVFDTTNTAHNLNLTIYGNVSGLATNESYPAPDDPRWSNPNETLGKIININDFNPEAPKYTTLIEELNVLTYTPYKPDKSPFCNHVVNGECPIGPAFYVDPNDTSRLPGFTFSHDMLSSYAFATIVPTFQVKSGDTPPLSLACISASITPDLGQTLKDLIAYLPLVVLVTVGIATIIAAIFSPWGTSDIFRWSSNYGRDQDLLRLVTPGFADCLGYIQFIFLTGSLSLSYPGYYQPVTSQVGWSSLMFNESFVTHGNGSRPINDGIYTINGTHGLERTSQLVGMTSVKDIWAGMMIWLLVIVATVILLIQLGFFLRWVLRTVSKVQEEDLRSKNLPFTVGNVIRVVCNYFLFPLVALSMYQLVTAPQGPAYAVALAVVVLVSLVLFIAWVILLLMRTPRRSFLFDDLPTVLFYGPLYNTYSDGAATFALVPLFINLLRGVAIGAVQPSGVTQIVLLAACEVILALTLNAFRPYPSPTSMNIWQTFFALVRLITILLSIAFVPSLGLTEAPKGWIGYVILLMHAAVLTLGFFLNALSTIFEIIARLAGAGGDVSTAGAAARGGLSKVFGLRQLHRRVPRREVVTRQSMASDAAMLAQDRDQQTIQLEGGRVRSGSASSAQLLRSDRASTAFDAASTGVGHSRGSGSGQYTPTTPVAGSVYNMAPSRTRAGSMSPGGIMGIKQAETADPYYRVPRPKRNTIDSASPAEPSRSSWASGDWTKRQGDPPETDALSEEDIGEGPSSGVKENTKIQLDDFADEGVNDLKRTKTDYAVREVDFYYGVRGPALSSGTVRRLKTGPADPTGPVSSATGWFKGLFGGKTKDQGKGFEVVRSARAPPPGLMRAMDGPHINAEPYNDEPDGPSQLESERRLEPHRESEEISDYEFPVPFADEYDSDDDITHGSRVSPMPPSLPAIDTGGGIELPSRVGSRASHISRKPSDARPPVPRRSSRRGSSADLGKSGIPAARLPTVSASPPGSPGAPRRLYDPDLHNQVRLAPSPSQRLPFTSSGSNVSPAKTQGSVNSSAADSSLVQLADEETKQPAPVARQHKRTPSSALGQLAADTRGDRPSSMGYVAHHRAGDSIHQTSPESPQFQESRAEFVDNRRSDDS